MTIDLQSPIEDQGYQLITFKGEFDKAGHAEIKEKLDDAVKSLTVKSLLFDFSELRFINSEGIGYLMEIHTHLVQREKQLVILGVKDHINDVFTAIGINEIIPLFPSLSDFLNKE